MSSEGAVNEMDVELYKILKAEASSYLDKIQTLWLQKFTLTGAVIAFSLLNGQAILTAGFGHGATIGLVLIPVLAIVIDLKVAEFSFHTRAISRFIAREFSADTTVAKWERTLWGMERTPESRDVAFRSVLTITSAAAPTIALVAAASLYLSRAYGGWPLMIGAGVSLLYVAAVIAATIDVFRRN